MAGGNLTASTARPALFERADGIWTIDGFLSPEECEAWIARGEAIGFAAAPVTTVFGSIAESGVRSNARVMYDDPVAGAALWDRLRPFVPALPDGRRAVGVNERLRLYRYDRGQALRWHTDTTFERLNGERSALTFMVYLNDGFQGGETEFEPLTVVPVPGMALLFRHELVHQGAPVKAGRKYVLRSDVMFAASPPRAEGD